MNGENPQSNEDRIHITYRNIASSYAINCNGSTAPSAVNGPLEGMTMGSSSKPFARLFLSVIMMILAPRALT